MRKEWRTGRWDLECMHSWLEVEKKLWQVTYMHPQHCILCTAVQLLKHTSLRWSRQLLNWMTFPQLYVHSLLNSFFLFPEPITNDRPSFFRSSQKTNDAMINNVRCAYLYRIQDRHAFNVNFIRTYRQNGPMSDLGNRSTARTTHHCWK